MPSPWKKIEYSFDPEDGSIILPEGLPFNGEKVLIKNKTGIVDAWWKMGEWTDATPDSPAEYDGWHWVCYDDAFTVDLDEAKFWMEIPEVEE